MLTQKEVSMVMEALLSTPYMDDEMKFLFRTTPKTVLLLVKCIEIGLTLKDHPDHQMWFTAANEQTLSTLRDISVELLNLAKLGDMYSKIQNLQIK